MNDFPSRSILPHADPRAVPEAIHNSGIFYEN